jgi:hypothetical protein
MTMATGKMLARASSGTGEVEEIDLTAAGRALLDDADAAAQRATLGLGALAVLNSPFQFTANLFTLKLIATLRANVALKKLFKLKMVSPSNLIKTILFLLTKLALSKLAI